VDPTPVPPVVIPESVLPESVEPEASTISPEEPEAVPAKPVEV